MVRFTSNDVAWEAAFERHNVIRRVSDFGFADVTAKELSEFREPRLMGKIDHEEGLPKVFKTNRLSILTLTNSSYRVGPFKTFQELPDWRMPDAEMEMLDFPSDLETLDFKNLTGEPGVINAANASDMLSTFCRQDVRLTVSGRMRTPEFSYRVNTHDGGSQELTVSKAQIEIDAGYEGKDAFFVFEVKNHSAKNFNLRQLYYPYRTWTARIRKDVVPVFLTLSNDVFDFYQFAFADASNYSSASLVRHKRYMLKHANPETRELVDLAKRGVGVRINQEIPFLQADKVEKVIDLVGVLLDSPQTAEELATYYGFDPRQSDYYFNAARLLGLAISEKTEDGVSIRSASPLAQEVFSKPYREKYLALAKLVLGVDSVAKTYLEWVTKSSKPSKADVERILANSTDSEGISGSTITRRAQTVLAWAGWVVNLAED